ncbi:MAG: hypothetical protein OZ948_09295 [Deltaproteobacteria bacterium]|nr:hypothetical protein [Deltaproteobacteria bacterium]
MAFKFPSLDFFRELARRMNADRATFEKLGFCDTVMGVRVQGPTPHLYALTFEVFDCSDVREIGDAREAELDFTLEAPLELWRAMLESICEHGRPAPEYTLNSLSHLGNRMRVVYDDPEGHDKLYRFMATLQAYFDNARDLEIEWA